MQIYMVSVVWVRGRQRETETVGEVGEVRWVRSWRWRWCFRMNFVARNLRDPLLIFYDIRYVDILRISILLGLSFFNVCIFF